MIKANIKGGEKAELEVCGNIRDITAEATLFVHMIWDRINQQDEDAGKIFKELFCKAVDEVVFEDEEGIVKAAKKAAKNAADASGKSLDELKKELIDLLKEL